MFKSRDIAVKVLGRVENEGAFAAAVLAAETERLKDRREASLAYEIVLGVLRNRSWLDKLIDDARTGKKRLDPKVRHILRVGGYQILFLERIPERAAIFEAVEQTKRLGVSKASGLVNAVLRRLSELDDKYRRPGVELGENLGVEAVALHGSLPLWLAARFVQLYGEDVALELGRVFNGPSRRTLRINGNIEDVVKDLGDKFERGRLSPWAIHVPKLAIVDELVEAGIAVVQDENAQLISLALEAAEGQLILDGCAGRGGKTGHLAMITAGKSTIVAADNHESKLERLEFELERQGHSVSTQVCDLAQDVSTLGSSFDRILLDAPCSGTGTLGRRPDIRWRLKEKDVDALTGVQTEMLSRTIPLLRKGGRLVFAVCSLLPEEGVARAEGLLNAHRDLSLVRLPPDNWPTSIDWNGGCVTLDPIETGSDGYQMIALERN